MPTEHAVTLLKHGKPMSYRLCTVCDHYAQRLSERKWCAACEHEFRVLSTAREAKGAVP